jgi:hypothetical protein
MKTFKNIKSPSKISLNSSKFRDDLPDEKQNNWKIMKNYCKKFDIGIDSASDSDK